MASDCSDSFWSDNYDECMCDRGNVAYCNDGISLPGLFGGLAFVIIVIVLVVVCCCKRNQMGQVYRQTSQRMFQTQSATPNTGTYGAPSPGGFTVHPPPQQQGSYPQHQTNYPQHQTNYPQQQGSYPQQQHQGFSPAHDLPPSYESAVGDRQPPFNPSYPAEKQPL